MLGEGILDISQFWYTTALFWPLESTPKSDWIYQNWPKRVEMRQNFAHSMLKVHWLEKSTPLLVVTVVTNISDGWRAFTEGVHRLINCPIQLACFAHFDLWICFITNPKWEMWKKHSRGGLISLTNKLNCLQRLSVLNIWIGAWPSFFRLCSFATISSFGRWPCFLPFFQDHFRIVSLRLWTQQWVKDSVLMLPCVRNIHLIFNQAGKELKQGNKLFNLFVRISPLSPIWEIV